MHFKDAAQPSSVMSLGQSVTKLDLQLSVMTIETELVVKALFSESLKCVLYFNINFGDDDG